jgi:hypothetical protein
MIFGLLALVLFIVAIVQFFRGQILLGVVLLIAACAVGPGGWFIFA